MSIQIGAFFPTNDLPADRVAIRDWAQASGRSASILLWSRTTSSGLTGQRYPTLMSLLLKQMVVTMWTTRSMKSL